VNWNYGNSVFKTVFASFFLVAIAFSAFACAASSGATDSFIVPDVDQVLVYPASHAALKTTASEGIVYYFGGESVKVRLTKTGATGFWGWMAKTFTTTTETYNKYQNIEVSVKKIIFNAKCAAALPANIPASSQQTSPVSIDLKSNGNKQKQVKLVSEPLVAIKLDEVAGLFVPTPYCDPLVAPEFKSVPVCTKSNTYVPDTLEFWWENNWDTGDVLEGMPTNLLVPLYYTKLANNAEGKWSSEPLLVTKVVLESGAPERLETRPRLAGESSQGASWFFKRNTCELNPTNFLHAQYGLCSHQTDVLSTAPRGVHFKSTGKSAVTVYAIKQEQKTSEPRITSFKVSEATPSKIVMQYELSAPAAALVKLTPKLYDESALAAFGLDPQKDYYAKYATKFYSATVHYGDWNARNPKGTYTDAGTQLYYNTDSLKSNAKLTKEQIDWNYRAGGNEKFYAATYEISLQLPQYQQEMKALNEYGLPATELVNANADDKAQIAQVIIEPGELAKAETMWEYSYHVQTATAPNTLNVVVYSAVGGQIGAQGMPVESYIASSGSEPLKLGKLYYVKKSVPAEAATFEITKLAESDYYVLTVYRGVKEEATAPAAGAAGLKKRGEACTPTIEWDDTIAACVKQSGVNPSSCPNLANYRGDCVATQKSEDGSKDYYLSCVKNLKPAASAPDYICAAMYQVSGGSNCYAVDPRANTPSECVQPASGKSLCLRPYDAQKKAGGVFYGSCTKGGTYDQEAGPSSEYCRVQITFNEANTADNVVPLIKVNAEWLVTQASGANKAVLKITYPSELSGAAGFKDDFTSYSKAFGYPDLKVGSKQAYPLTYEVSKPSSVLLKNYLAAKSGSFSGFKFELELSKQSGNGAAESKRTIKCVLTGSLTAKPAPKTDELTRSPEGGYCEAFDDPYINLDGAKTWGKLYQIVDIAAFFSVIPAVTVSKLLGYGPRAYVTQIDYYLADAPTEGRTPSELKALVFPYGRWININKAAMLFPWMTLFTPLAGYAYTPVGAVIYTTPGGGNRKTTTAFFVSFSPFAWHKMPDVNIGSHAIWKQGNVVSVFYGRDENPFAPGASSGVSTQGRTTTASVTESASFTQSLFNTWCPLADDRDCGFLYSDGKTGEHKVRIAVTENDFQKLGLQNTVYFDLIELGPQITKTEELTKGTECVFGSNGKLECSVGPDSKYAREQGKFLRFKFKDSDGKVVAYADCIPPSRDVTAPAEKEPSTPAQKTASAKNLEEKAACTFTWYNLFFPGEYTGGIYPVKISFNTPDWNAFNPPYQYGLVKLTYNDDGDTAQFQYLLQRTMQRTAWFDGVMADSATAKLLLYKYKQAMDSNLEADASAPCEIKVETPTLECSVDLANNKVYYYAGGDVTAMVRNAGALVLSYALDGEDKSEKLVYLQNKGYSEGYLKMPDYVKGKLGDATDFELWTFKKAKSVAPVGFDNLRIEGDTYLHVKCKTA